MYLGTILKCDRPNEARCCSISFDSSESSVTLKGASAVVEVPSLPPTMATLQTTTSADNESTKIPNEIEENIIDESNELVQSTDASNDEFNTTPLNDEQLTTIAPNEIRHVDVEEQRRREEIQRIYASKEFNGSNPSYVQIINNLPTLLVYATSNGDWNGVDDEIVDSTTIQTTEQSVQDLTESPVEGSGAIDSNEFGVLSTESPSAENIEIDDFVSTLEHSNLTEVRHNKRQSNYRDRNLDQVIQKTPEYYETGGDYEEFDGNVSKLDGSDDYYVETEKDSEHQAQLTAVQSLLATIQKKSGAQKPVINQFNTLQQMVEYSKQKFSAATMGQTAVRNNYNFKTQASKFRPNTATKKQTASPPLTITTTTTQRIGTMEHEDRKSKRKYLQRQLPAVAKESSLIEKPKIATTTAALPSIERDTQNTQTVYSKNRSRTKPTTKKVENESSASVVRANESTQKFAHEFRDSQPQLQTAVKKRNQLFGTKRRNILDKTVTSTSIPLVDETTTMMAAKMATPENGQQISSSTEFIRELSKFNTT